ncbi:hypothetical protein ILUMI_12547, partial [Ignelater luminosus]
FKQDDYTLKLHIIRVARFNHSYVSDSRCDLRWFNRSTRVVDCNVNLIRDLTSNAQIDLQLYKFASNEYRLFPLQFAVNVCHEIKEDRFGVIEGLRSAINVELTCPLKKRRYIVKNEVLDYTKFPPHIPRGQYMMQGILVDNKNFVWEMQTEVVIEEIMKNYLLSECSRMSLACHTLHLIATKDAEKAMINARYKQIFRSTLAKCHKLWAKQNRSTQAADKMKDMLGAYLKTPVVTRWNSLYDAMLQINNHITHLPDSINTCMDFCALPRFTDAEREFIKEYCQKELVLASCVHPRFKLAWLKDSKKREQAENWVYEEIPSPNPKMQTSGAADLEYNDFFCLTFNADEHTKTPHEQVKIFLSEQPKETDSFSCSALRKLFIKHNTALPTSASAERLFSFAGNVLSQKRCQLTDDINQRDGLPTGDFLGAMTDKIACYGEDSQIVEYVSGDPKDYAIILFSTNKNDYVIICKVKGITLNYKNSREVNFSKLKEKVLDNAGATFMLRQTEKYVEPPHSM